jgi:uncharacterized membrane protein
MTRRAGWLLMSLLALLILVLVAPYFLFDPDLYFDQQRSVYLARQGMLYAHIGGAAVALATMPIQFAAALRRRVPALHRVCGRLYVTGVLIGGISGLAMSTTAHGGVVSGLGFAGLAVAWLATTAVALNAILRGDVTAHRRWMMRSASLTFAAVTLRLYLGTLTGLNAAGVTEIDLVTAYVAIAWLCWTPNLALVWWLTRRRPGSRRGSAHALLPVDALPQDVGVPGVLGGLGHDVQEHPARRPAGPRREPRRLG